MSIPFLENPEYWRMRAKEARVLVEQLKDAHSKNVMRGIAKDYERMAEQRMSNLPFTDKTGVFEIPVSTAAAQRHY
jgi:hypothetical protein